jgi:hypothetical protein
MTIPQKLINNIYTGIPENKLGNVYRGICLKPNFVTTLLLPLSITLRLRTDFLNTYRVQTRIKSYWQCCGSGPVLDRI